jgi:hypothetical protein
MVVLYRPSKSSCKVRFTVHASFELDAMLGHGDILRGFEISVAELLDRSENSRRQYLLFSIAVTRC